MAKTKKSKSVKDEVQEDIFARPVGMAKITLESDESEKRHYQFKRDGALTIILYVSILLFLAFITIVLLLDKGIIPQANSLTCIPTELLKTAMMR